MECGGKVVHHRTVSDEDEKVDIKKQKLKLDIKKQKLDEENVETSSRLQTFENKEIFVDDYYEQEDGFRTMTFQDLDSDQLDMIKNDVSTYPFLDNVLTLRDKRLLSPFQNNSQWYNSSSSSPNPAFRNNSPWYNSSSSSPNPFLDKEEYVLTLREKRLLSRNPAFRNNSPWYNSSSSSPNLPFQNKNPWYNSSSSSPNLPFQNRFSIPNRTQLPKKLQPYTTHSSPYMSTNGAKTYTDESQPHIVLNDTWPPEIQPRDPKAAKEYLKKQRERGIARFKQLYPQQVKDMEKYNIEVQNSEGFDVSIYPSLRSYCGIITRAYCLPDTPVSAQTMEILTSLAVEPINHYNSQEGTNYTHDVTVIKAMVAGAGNGLLYYLTFQAFLPDSKNSPQTFEAKVLWRMAEFIEVQFVRLKKPN